MPRFNVLHWDADQVARGSPFLGLNKSSPDFIIQPESGPQTSGFLSQQAMLHRKKQCGRQNLQACNLLRLCVTWQFGLILARRRHLWEKFCHLYIRQGADRIWKMGEYVGRHSSCSGSSLLFLFVITIEFWLGVYTMQLAISIWIIRTL